jgi:hypothetical protein
LLRGIRHAPPAALCESQRTPRLCVSLPLFLRRYLLSLFSQSPLSALFPFNYLRTLSFSVSYLSAVLPTPSALFYQKPGCTPSGHTNASDGPRLSLRNLFSLLATHHFLPLPITNHFRGHTNVNEAGGRRVLQRYFSLRGAAARSAASNGWAWSKGREMRKRSARRAWAYFS